MMSATPQGPGRAGEETTTAVGNMLCQRESVVLVQCVSWSATTAPARMILMIACRLVAVRES